MSKKTNYTTFFTWEIPIHTDRIMLANKSHIVLEDRANQFSFR